MNGISHSSGHRLRQAAFTNAASAEAWDAWFRWRDGAELHDLTIDATFDRVARALAGAGPAPTQERCERYRRAFGDWRLLPDPSVLRHAGTGRAGWSDEEPVVTINLAAFVRAPLTLDAALKEGALADAARLAAAMLDDTNTLMGRGPEVRRGVVALMGIADAVAMLGLRYGSDEACMFARRVGSIVSEAITTHVARAAPALSIRIELRRQPRLALLANATSDAADPIPDEHVVRWPGTACDDRRTRALGPALTLQRAASGACAPRAQIETARSVDDEARARMSAAFAPWLEPVPRARVAARGESSRGADPSNPGGSDA